MLYSSALCRVPSLAQQALGMHLALRFCVSPPGPLLLLLFWAAAINWLPSDLAGGLVYLLPALSAVHSIPPRVHIVG
jgi:hypothetical protein